jgi:hypothetical protein
MMRDWSPAVWAEEDAGRERDCGLDFFVGMSYLFKRVAVVRHAALPASSDATYNVQISIWKVLFKCFLCDEYTS